MEDAIAKTSESDIRQLFKSATVLRGDIARQNKHPWEFDGQLSIDDAEKHVPKTLYTFIRWIIEGPATSIEAETLRSATIHRDVLAVSQRIMNCFKSKRQVMQKPKCPEAPFRHRLEWLHLLAVGIYSLPVHQKQEAS